jgi:hypothetical protein
VAPERKRSARDYEQALRRQELAAGRALVQALGDGSPGARELAAAKRALTQALFDLRRLGRDLDQEIEGLRAKGSRPTRAAQGSGPGELDRIEAARSAVEELAERWEGRRDQLGAELDRRQPRRRQAQAQGQRQRGEQGRRSGQPQPREREGGQPRGARDRGDVSGRRGAAPARPARPRSRPSRRSPG